MKSDSGEPSLHASCYAARHGDQHPGQSGLACAHRTAPRACGRPRPARHYPRDMAPFSAIAEPSDARMPTSQPISRPAPKRDCSDRTFEPLPQRLGGDSAAFPCCRWWRLCAPTLTDLSHVLTQADAPAMLDLVAATAPAPAAPSAVPARHVDVPGRSSLRSRRNVVARRRSGEASFSVCEVGAPPASCPAPRGRRRTSGSIVSRSLDRPLELTPCHGCASSATLAPVHPARSSASLSVSVGFVWPRLKVRVLANSRQRSGFIALLITVTC